MERRRRMRYLAWVILLLGIALSAQGLTANETASGNSVTEGAYPGHTLISVQSYGLSGRLVEVDENGEVVWEFAPPNSRVFDAEQLENGNILVAVATQRDSEECPLQQLLLVTDRCVQNRVLELDYPSKEVVWKYEWYDEYITHHEVHDVDRLDDGSTAVVDMGNDRAFVVNESGETTWEWQAERHLGTGTAFHARYGGPSDPGGERDWTHMNDIDEIDNGNFQISVRNFDAIVELDPATKEIVDVVGEPDNHSLLSRQHNPHRLRDGTVLVADSENDRVVEIDPETDEIVWQYGGRELLHWPRDADRLPNGNTLIVDTFNDRVVEINRHGEIVWKYEGVQMPYAADRLSVSEEDHETVPGTELQGQHQGVDAVRSILEQAEAYASFVFPAWVRLPELLALAGMVCCSLWLLVEAAVELAHGGERS